MSSLPKRPLGTTGEEVSILALGGGHVARQNIPSSEVIRIIRHAIDQGVTFIDSAWEYHGGRSEALIGEAIRGCRDELFLMTKVCARDRAGALEQLDESLRRLGTDRLDLWQFHEVNYDNDHEWIFAPGGAAEAARQAIESGKVRYVGFTGHKHPDFLLSMLEHDFPYTTVQLPINVLDASFRSFGRRVLPELAKRGIAALGMKSLGGEGQLVTKAGLTPEECIRFALSQPIASLVSGMDSIRVVDQNVAIARDFRPMSEEELRELAKKTAKIASDGRHEWFKTTPYFDSKYHRDQHGFPGLLVAN
jgi:predicted aldo/keto reductase-like oxidoreductase